MINDTYSMLLMRNGMGRGSMGNEVYSCMGCNAIHANLISKHESNDDIVEAGNRTCLCWLRASVKAATICLAFVNRFPLDLQRTGDVFVVLIVSGMLSLVAGHGLRERHHYCSTSRWIRCPSIGEVVAKLVV